MTLLSLDTLYLIRLILKIKLFCIVPKYPEYQKMRPSDDMLLRHFN